MDKKNIKLNENISEIDIKILDNKYEIDLNKIIKNTNFVISYEGKDIITNEKIVIDKYNTNILLLSRKLINNIINIKHKNTINLIDIVIEKNITYIIKPYYENTLISYYEIYKNNNKLIKDYCESITKQLIDCNPPYEQNILNLTPEEQDSFFQMITDNATLLIKIVPNSRLLAYVISGTPEDESPITQAYTQWKNK